MCGIFGLIDYRGVDAREIGVRLQKLARRGPDSEGKWVSDCGRVAFGHRRLSVIDLSLSANQPMSTRDGRFTIVFNGEIYNFQEIRARLLSLGYQFHTQSDTEVLLNAYAQWGADCVTELNGMFAFAIHDRGSHREAPSIFLARDRAGEKPLYLSQSSGRFSFASELKAIDHSRSINLHALNHYLALGYIPGRLSLAAGVEKLPPGHCARLNLESGQLKTWRYWTLPANQANELADGTELAETAGRLIEDSVRLRLVADVPIGVLLSGGLDSSLITAAAARVSALPVKTFTIALPGSPLDEAHHARKVADFLGTRHHVLELEKPSLTLIDDLAPLIDEPIADSSILPAWLVFGLAREQVTVALGGDGGDELFGGYSEYAQSLADHRRLRRLPASLLRSVAGLAALLPAGVRGRNRLASLRAGALQQTIWGSPYFDESLRRRVLSSRVWRELQGQQMAPEEFLLSLFLSGTSDVDRMTRTQFGSILPDDFLTKVDRASMAHSLEVRAPLLDHRLIEFCFSQVPDHWKVEGGESRRLQRILARQWLPRDLDTRRKQGFSIPINEWLRAESESRLMSRMEGLPDVINPDEVRSLVRGHLKGRANGGRLFALIMLAIASRNIF